MVGSPRRFFSQSSKREPRCLSSADRVPTLPFSPCGSRNTPKSHLVLGLLYCMAFISKQTKIILLFSFEPSKLKKWNKTKTKPTISGFANESFGFNNYSFLFLKWLPEATLESGSEHWVLSSSSPIKAASLDSWDLESLSFKSKEQLNKDLSTKVSHRLRTEKTYFFPLQIKISIFSYWNMDNVTV